ncbi:MAG: exo-alpha-sialidase, partial [Bacteroidales bacterium]
KKRVLSLLCLTLFVGSCQKSGEVEPPLENILKLGNRLFEIEERTPTGTPIVHLWEAQEPNGIKAEAYGYPHLNGAEHYMIWEPANISEGSYNHMAALFHFNGLFYAMWSSQIEKYGESSPGQRVLFSTSMDGKSWNSPRELFSAPDEHKPQGEQGLFLSVERWMEIDGKLLAVIYAQGSGPRYPLAKEVLNGGDSFGLPFLLRPISANSKLPSFMPTPRFDTELSKKIEQWYKNNDKISWFSDTKGIPVVGVEGSKLLESFAFRAKSGMVVFMRDYNSQTKDNNRVSSNRIFASFCDDNGKWSPLYPTDIPDSHSRAEALTLPDGRVLLIGNQFTTKFDEGIYLQRDPLTLAVSEDGDIFNRVYSLRSGGAAGIKRKFSGVPGSGPIGYGYPSMIYFENKIYALYSINKEDMAITIFPLSSID